jgi:branched-chain amino acid transport system permease protein
MRSREPAPQEMMRGPSPFWRIARLRRPSTLHTRYSDEMRVLPDRGSRVGLALLLVLAAMGPFLLTDFWLSVLNFAAIATIGALGLNLLTGFTGQISLGHAFFIGLGAYTAGYLGGDLGWPVLAWLPAAGLLGAVVGLAVGPFALRLRGLYLAIVTLGLVFVGIHLFRNVRFITGGSRGRGVPSPQVGPLDFGDLGGTFGIQLTPDQSFYYFLVPLAALAILVAKNITRSRPGRAFQAVRDRELAASVLGVNLSRYKIAAFAVSSAYTAVAGALLGSYMGFISPGQFNLFLSIEYVAMIIVGGIGTILGSVLGAAFLVLIPRLVEQFSDSIPFVGRGAALDVFILNQIIFGVLIIVFLVKEPLGLAGIWRRAKIYFKSWPFSY